mgnify:FL=1
MRSLSPLSRRILKKAGIAAAFFCSAFLFGSVLSHFTCRALRKAAPVFLSAAPETPVSSVSMPVLSSAAENWGLSFPEKGKTPVGNATSEELAAYNAWFAASPEENIIYLTFDCGYENGNTPAILDALQKHQAPAAFFVVGNFSLRPAGSCQTHGGRRPYRRKPHLVAPGYVQNFHAGSLLRRAEPCFRSLPGNHQPGNGEILPASAGKIQHAEPADGKRSRLSDFFLESCLCRLVPGSAADPRGGFQKVDRTHSSRCHRPAS